MTPPARELDHLQRWLLDSITNPTDTARSVVEVRILPSQQQSAGERLAIYQHAYLARLLEVLRDLLPCTRFAVADELFDQFAIAYLQAHPPRSYTLGRLAENLVDHLNATRPADWGDFVVELVRLELAIDRVFDAPGPESSPPFALPVDSGPSLRLNVVPGFELHSFAFPISTYFTEWKADRQPGWPDRGHQYVALFRRDYIVRRYELTELQYRLLLALQRGMPLDDAIADALDGNPADSDQLAAEVNRWFALWSAERFFAAATNS